MVNQQSLRLAQFWHSRFAPLLGTFSESKEQPQRDAAEFFESLGWLVEGVFCGFFDTRESDIVWIKLNRLRDHYGLPTPPMTMPDLASEITNRYQSSEPFLTSLQMQEGPQKAFELPLFSHALLIADRFAKDKLANFCGYCIQYLPDDRWLAWQEEWRSIDPSLVATRVLQPEDPTRDTISLLAGYLRLIEHMEASRHFFEYAKDRSGYGVDFESYCQRIGGLNAWRIPLYDSKATSRFEQLSNLLEYALRPAIALANPGTQWSDFDSAFRQYQKRLVETWETYHLAGLFAMG